MFTDGTAPSLVNPSELTFTMAGSVATVNTNGVVTAGSTAGQDIVEIVATSKPTLVAKAVITVTE